MSVYKHILINQLAGSVKKLFPAKNAELMFQHDNDPKHTAKSVKQYLRNKKYSVMDWPAQSPDLNPIENLWFVIENRLKHRVCSNEEELFEALQAQWQALEPELLAKLVGSMPKRCAAVIESKGYPTKY